MIGIIAGAMTYTGLRRTFMGDLDLRRLGPAEEHGVELVGAVGHLARALALAVIGTLAGAAALFADPRRAGGLDTALRLLGSTRRGRHAAARGGGRVRRVRPVLLRRRRPPTCLTRPL